MSRFWFRHAVAPGATYVALMSLILGAHLDTRIARSWAYDQAGGWLGAHSWWAENVMHTGGRAVIALICLSALVLCAFTFIRPRYRTLRAGALYIALGILLCTGIVGLLKDVSNVDCPWNLQGFGGDRPYVALLDHRPSGLPAAGCFPGAHSSSGFALMGFYFLLLDRSRRAARWALTGGLLVGTLFAFGQEARGAHFLSHDLTSAVLVWYVLLGLALVILRRREPWSSLATS